MAHTSEESDFLTHIATQVRDDIAFLEKHGYISREDASSCLAKLPAHPSMPTPTPHPAVLSSTHAPPPPPAVPQARALWAWVGQDSGDLSFAQGDTIEITEETNKDWWTGRIADRKGVFPASYVEKIQAPTTINEKPVYRPFRAAYHGMNQPPAPLAPMPGPPGQSNPIVIQEAPRQEDKYGDLKKTMANSAAGGVGFGAGAAIGSGLINSIF